MTLVRNVAFAFLVIGSTTFGSHGVAEYAEQVLTSKRQRVYIYHAPKAWLVEIDKVERIEGKGRKIEYLWTVHDVPDEWSTEHLPSFTLHATGDEIRYTAGSARSGISPGFIRPSDVREGTRLVLVFDRLPDAKNRVSAKIPQPVMIFEADTFRRDR